MPAPPPPARTRKRPLPLDPPPLPNEPAKRIAPAPAPAPQRANIRAVSPSKNVHFPRNLVMGPHASDPKRRRSESPVRSALLRREGEGGEVDDEAGAQLRREQEEEGGLVGREEEGEEEDEGGISVAMIEEKLNKFPRPNVMKKISAKRTSSSPAKKDLEPPDLDFFPTHDQVCNELDVLKRKILEFADTFPPPEKGSDVLTTLFKPKNKQLVRYISRLALGGRQGVEGWRELLSDVQARRAIVLGIIGRALKEVVFDELCFGGEEELGEVLAEKEREEIGRDGFFRTRERADTIWRLHETLITQSSIDSAVAHTTVQLERMLLPLWTQGSTVSEWTKSSQRASLTDVVTSAAHLSISMRTDRDTVYYWPPTFKDEEFEPERMECVNLRNMITGSPYDTKEVNGYQRAVLRKGHEHEATALVRIVCFPGVVAYQQGGGDLARQELAKQGRQLDALPPDVRRNYKKSRAGENALTGDEGFRTKVLCKAVVFLQWGKQRLLTKEAGTSNQRAAMKGGGKRYEVDSRGFVDLYDLFLEETSRLEDGSHSGWLASGMRLFSRSPSVH